MLLNDILLALPGATRYVKASHPPVRPLLVSAIFTRRKLHILSAISCFTALARVRLRLTQNALHRQQHRFSVFTFRRQTAALSSCALLATGEPFSGRTPVKVAASAPYYVITTQWHWRYRQAGGNRHKRIIAAKPPDCLSVEHSSALPFAR